MLGSRDWTDLRREKTPGSITPHQARPESAAWALTPHLCSTGALSPWRSCGRRPSGCGQSQRSCSRWATSLARGTPHGDCQLGKVLWGQGQSRQSGTSSQMLPAHSRGKRRQLWCGPCSSSLLTLLLPASSASLLAALLGTGRHNICATYGVVSTVCLQRPCAELGRTSHPAGHWHSCSMCDSSAGDVSLWFFPHLTVSLPYSRWQGLSHLLVQLAESFPSVHIRILCNTHLERLTPHPEPLDEEGG